MSIKNISILFSALVLSAFNANADFNKDCKFAYRQATVDLVAAISDFKTDKLSSFQLGTTVTEIETAVKAHRAECFFVEAPANKECVSEYSEIFSELSSNTSAIALLIGTQETVDYSLLDLAKTEVQLGITDLKCEF